MRFIAILTAGLLGVGVSAAKAQDVPAASADAPLIAVVRETNDSRHALAERYMQLAIAGNLDKMIRDVMQTELATLSGVMPADELAWFNTNAAEILNRHVQTMLVTMTRYHAENFTVAELEGLIAFYDTELGRGIAIKQMEMGMEQGRMMEGFMTDYVNELTRKYCAAFDCAAASGVSGAAKPARR